jgi:5-methylcytosine-specific restriction endonuclease McrA
MEKGWARSFDKEKGEECCEECGQPFAGRRPEFHHIICAALGGDNSLSNMKVLCNPCHRYITFTKDLPRIVKAKSIEEKRAGLRRSKHKIQSRGFERKRANG